MGCDRDRDGLESEQKIRGNIYLSSSLFRSGGVGKGRKAEADVGFAAGFFLFSSLLFTETGEGGERRYLFEGREAGANTCWLEPPVAHAFFFFFLFRQMV